MLEFYRFIALIAVLSMGYGAISAFNEIILPEPDYTAALIDVVAAVVSLVVGNLARLAAEKGSH